MNLSTRRIGVVIVLLCLCEGVQLLRNRAEVRPNTPALQGYPMVVGDWRGEDEHMAQSVLDVLGPGDFLSRLYTKPGTPPVEIFVAYFASQRSGDTIHSPKNCLPGSGWQPLDSGVTVIPLGNGRSTRATRYIVAKGSSRQLVMYWFQSHGKATSSEYAAKFQLIADAIRMNRTDGALVRVVTPVVPGESDAQSELRAAEFMSAAYPALDRFIPL